MHEYAPNASVCATIRVIRQRRRHQAGNRIHLRWPFQEPSVWKAMPMNLRFVRTLLIFDVCTICVQILTLNLEDIESREKVRRPPQGPKPTTSPNIAPIRTICTCQVPRSATTLRFVEPLSQIWLPQLECVENTCDNFVAWGTLPIHDTIFIIGLLTRLYSSARPGHVNTQRAEAAATSNAATTT